MRIYISLDMEGIPGTWNWEQEKSNRNSVRKAMYEHTKDVIEAILESERNREIEEIIIADSHGLGDNLDYEITTLDQRVSLISGSPRPNYMMPAFRDDISGVILLGYHSGAGTQFGNMDHTYSNRRVHQIRINNQVMNEALINAAYAGCFNVPVIMISGDLALYQELQATPLSKAEFVITKEAISKFSVKNYSKLLVQEETKLKVTRGIEHLAEIDSHFTFFEPITLEICFNSTSMADVASLIPHTVRRDGRTVLFTDNDYRVIFETVMAMTTIAYTVDP